MGGRGSFEMEAGNSIDSDKGKKGKIDESLYRQASMHGFAHSHDVVEQGSVLALGRRCFGK